MESLIKMALKPSIGCSNNFYNHICFLRGQAEEKRVATKLFRPAGPMTLDTQWCPKARRLTIWYEKNDWQLEAIRLTDEPHTLSGEILRLNANPPPRAGFLDVSGNCIRDGGHAPPLPEEVPPDDEDVHEATAKLPVVKFEPQIHFRKRSKYRSETANLLLCQGGSCPGSRLSRHLVQLLGVDSDGLLVFKKLSGWTALEKCLRSIAAYKRCLIQLISGLEALHSVGIVHRDLRLPNLLFDEEEGAVVICDLESRWGNRLAPEIEDTTGYEGVWSVETDIFDLGVCLRDLIYMNNPILRTLERAVPSPFDKIFEACVQTKPERRPSLKELRSMVEQIEDTESGQ